MKLNLIQNYFTPKNVLDVGANVGDFTRTCSLMYPNADFFMVEGNPACESIIKKLGHEYFIGLLSDEQKTVKFYVDKTNPTSTGNSFYRENTEHFSDNNVIVQDLETTTLDTIVGDRVFDLIKIDVQGSELEVLKGGVNTVQNATGIILELSLIEYNQNATLHDEMVDYMKSIGYEPVEKLYDHYDLDGRVIQMDVLFLNRRRNGV